MIRALHPDVTENPQTFITRKAPANQQHMDVLDTSDFVVGDLIIIGDIGAEQTEIRRISEILSKEAINITQPLGFTHEKNCRITATKYDSVAFYKAETIDGTYTQVALKPIAINEPHTLYDDTGSFSSDFFKIRYVNSYTTTYSVYSDAISQGGFPKYSLASITDAFLSEIQDKSQKFYTRDDIKTWVNDCKDDCFNKLSENNENYSIGVHEFPLIAGQNEIPLHKTFARMKYAEITYDGVNKTTLHFQDLADTSPSRSYDKSYPFYYLKGLTTIGIRPTPDVDVPHGLRITSEDMPADLRTDADELPSPLHRYGDMVMNYLWYRALRKDKKFQESRIYKAEYEQRRAEFIDETNNLVLNENRHITETEPDDMYDELY